ncbi:hypothetical protein ACIP5Y_17420 [Nocardia sp. NPDC088792]|uniref:hypothetical protein n=1 Tax=Nocardia sp. NPDC088792 TaxID=3364332 RepID=UPI0037F878B0
MVASRTATAATDPGRALSPSERWFWIVDRISPSNCCGRIRLHGRIDPASLERAAAALVAEYPLLRLGISAPGDRDPRLTPLTAPRIPLRRLESGDPDQWLRELDAEMSARFAVGTGLARLVDVVGGAGTAEETHDIIVTISHIIADGRSLMAVLRKLITYAATTGPVPGGSAADPVGKNADSARLTAVGRADEAEVGRLVGSAPGRAAVPPADDLIPAASRGFWRYAYTTLYDQAAALVLRPRRLSGAVPVPLPDRRTRIVHRSVTVEESRALLDDCRRAGVTVHGALAAAVARSIGAAAYSAASPEPRVRRWGGRGWRRADGGVGTRGAGHADEVAGARGVGGRRGVTGKRGVAGIGSPVDFRALLEPAPEADELGIYAPVLTGFVPFGAGVSLWEAARAINRQVRRGVRQRRHLATVAGMRFGTPRTVASGWRIAEMVDRRAPWNVSVTNLGRVEFPEKAGEWRLSGLVLAAGNSCVSAMTVAVVTAHGELHIGFCYVDRILPETAAAAFADDVLMALLDRPAPSGQ